MHSNTEEEPEPQRNEAYLKCHYEKGLFSEEYVIQFRQVPARRNGFNWMFVDRTYAIPTENGEGLARIASMQDECYRVVLYHMGDNSPRYVYKEDVVSLGGRIETIQ